MHLWRIAPTSPYGMSCRHMAGLPSLRPVGDLASLPLGGATVLPSQWEQWEWRLLFQARIQGGQGGLAPPPPPKKKKLLPEIVRRGSRGAKRALPPPPLTTSWIRLCIWCIQVGYDVIVVSLCHALWEFYSVYGLCRHKERK